jgi:hypothetical protein
MDRECQSGFGKFVCKVMEGIDFSWATVKMTVKMGVTNGDEAAMGVGGQTGVREHVEGGHVGKLEKAIQGSLVYIKRL